MKTLSLYWITFLTLFFTTLAWGSAPPSVVYDFQGHLFWGGRFSEIETFQAKLSEKLKACGQQPIEADGGFGRNTFRGVQNLTRCESFSRFSNSKITFEFWEKLFQLERFYPSVREQAVTLILSHTGSDFHKINWRQFSWGPLKAQMVQRENHFGGLIEHLAEQNPSEFRRIFGSDTGRLLRFARQQGRNAMRYFEDLGFDRKQRWIRGLKELAMSPKGRAAHIDYAFVSNKWLRPTVDRILGLLGENTTELDYAFAMDLATSFEVSASQARQISEKLSEHESLKPFERRRLIAQFLTSPEEEMRIARNVIYYIDGIEQSQMRLTRQERQAWDKHSEIKASHLGLREIAFDPYFIP